MMIEIWVSFAFIRVHFTILWALTLYHPFYCPTCQKWLRLLWWSGSVISETIRVCLGGLRLLKNGSGFFGGATFLVELKLFWKIFGKTVSPNCLIYTKNIKWLCYPCLFSIFLFSFLLRAYLEQRIRK